MMSMDKKIQKKLLKVHEETNQFMWNPDLSSIPPTFKKYDTEKQELPKKFDKSDVSIEDAIEKRVSRRVYGGKLTKEDVSKILFYAKGFRALQDTYRGILYTANAPSAGSRHPIELYVLLRGVEGLDNGVYHYEVENHSLEYLAPVSKEQVDSIFLNKDDALKGANMILFMTGIMERTATIYGMRSYRLVHLDAGHIGQNIYLIGEAMNLAVCALGNWDDASVKNLLGIDTDKEFIIYSVCVGKQVKE